MNDIEFYKKGNKIYIKKKNRGKFTDYCGGKVTNECIQRGKNSSDPKIRKRATFAANARVWKHQAGGQLISKIFKGLTPKLENTTQHIGPLHPKVLDIYKIADDEKRALSKFYQSSNYLKRFNWRPPYKVPPIIKQLVQDLKKTKVYPKKELSIEGSNASNTGGETLGLTRDRYPVFKFDEKGGFAGINYVEPAHVEIKYSINNPRHVIGHEFLHASSRGSEGISNPEKIYQVINPVTNKTELIPVTQKINGTDRIIEFDKRLMNGNVISKEEYLYLLNKEKPNISEKELQEASAAYDYLTSVQEWRAKGLQLQLEANRNGLSLKDYIETNPDNINYKQMSSFANPRQIYNFSSRALGLATPIGIGTYLVNNKSNNIT